MAPKFSRHARADGTKAPLNPKTPPGWDPADEDYTLRNVVGDLKTWMEIASPSIVLTQYGALVKLQMGGLARKVVDAIPADVLANGAIVDFNDSAGAQHRIGLE